MDAKRIELRIGDNVKVQRTKDGVTESGRKWQFIEVGNEKVKDNLFLFDDALMPEIREGDIVRIEDMTMVCAREKTKGGEWISRWRPKVRLSIVQMGNQFGTQYEDDNNFGELPF